MDGFADGAVERHGAIWVTDVVVKEFSLNFEKVKILISKIFLM